MVTPGASRLRAEVVEFRQAGPDRTWFRRNGGWVAERLAP